jgi:hypothetical protein
VVVLQAVIGLELNLARNAAGRMFCARNLRLRSRRVVLYVFQCFFIEAEIVAEFVDHGETDFFADDLFHRATCFGGRNLSAWATLRPVL